LLSLHHLWPYRTRKSGEMSDLARYLSMTILRACDFCGAFSPKGAGSQLGQGLSLVSGAGSLAVRTLEPLATLTRPCSPDWTKLELDLSQIIANSVGHNRIRPRPHAVVMMDRSKRRRWV
jgi:hypothetical protein